MTVQSEIDLTAYPGGIHMKKLVGILFFVSIMFLTTTSALAADLPVGITVSGLTTDQYAYDDGTGVLTISAGTSAVIEGDSGAYTNFAIAINVDDSFELNLSNISFTAPSNMNAITYIGPQGSVIALRSSGIVSVTGGSNGDTNATGNGIYAGNGLSDTVKMSVTINNEMSILGGSNNVGSVTGNGIVTRNGDVTVAENAAITGGNENFASNGTCGIGIVTRAQSGEGKATTTISASATIIGGNGNRGSQYGGTAILTTGNIIVNAPATITGGNENATDWGGDGVAIYSYSGNVEINAPAVISGGDKNSSGYSGNGISTYSYYTDSEVIINGEAMITGGNDNSGEFTGTGIVVSSEPKSAYLEINSSAAIMGGNNNIGDFCGNGVSVYSYDSQDTEKNAVVINDDVTISGGSYNSGICSGNGVVAHNDGGVPEIFIEVAGEAEICAGSENIGTGSGYSLYSAGDITTGENLGLLLAGNIVCDGTAVIHSGAASIVDSSGTAVTPVNKDGKALVPVEISLAGYTGMIWLTVEVATDDGSYTYRAKVLLDENGTAIIWIPEGNYTISGSKSATGTNVISQNLNIIDGITNSIDISVPKDQSSGNTKSTGSGNVNNKQTLSDLDSGISVTAFLSNGAKLTVSNAVLHQNCSSCSELLALREAGELLGLWNITVTGNNSGKFEVSFHLGSELDGEKVAVLHCNDGKLETIAGTVSDGKVAVSLDNLGIIAVTQVKGNEWDNHFIDVKTSDWFYDHVRYVWENELMAGVAETIFEPGSDVNRAMVVTVLWRMENEPVPLNNSRFTDLTESWYMDAVRWASENDIVEGYDSGLFGPSDPVTREQLAAILYRYSQYKGYDTSLRADLGRFVDMDHIGDWALESMQWASAKELISGRSATILAPDGTTSRAELAAVLHRFLTK